MTADVFPYAGDLGSFLAGIAAIWAVCQVKQWRKQAKAITRSQVATELMARAMEAKLALDDVRRTRAFEMVPVETEGESPEATVLKSRLNLLYQSGEIFDALNVAQVRHEVVIGGDEVKRAVDNLFDVRTKLRIKILSCLKHIEGMNSTGRYAEQDAEDLRMYWSEIFASDVDEERFAARKDDFQKSIDGAIEVLKKHLTPQARLDV